MKIERKVGWICSTSFDYELGQALGGEKVFASEEDLRKRTQCIDIPSDAGIECRAMRVYVFDADAFDAETKAGVSDKTKWDGKKAACNICKGEVDMEHAMRYWFRNGNPIDSETKFWCPNCVHKA